MSVSELIMQHLESLSKNKQSDLLSLHQRFLSCLPGTELSFHSGKDANGKTVSNPIIGYGSYKHRFASGKLEDMFKMGISANTSGISIYCMGLADKNLLRTKYAEQIGKATITGYCIKFKKLNDLNMDVLECLIKDLLK